MKVAAAVVGMVGADAMAVPDELYHFNAVPVAVSTGAGVSPTQTLSAATPGAAGIGFTVMSTFSLGLSQSACFRATYRLLTPGVAVLTVMSAPERGVPPEAALYQTSVPVPAAIAFVNVPEGTEVPAHTAAGAVAITGVGGMALTLTAMVAFGLSHPPTVCVTPKLEVATEAVEITGAEGRAAPPDEYHLRLAPVAVRTGAGVVPTHVLTGVVTNGALGMALTVRLIFSRLLSQSPVLRATYRLFSPAVVVLTVMLPGVRGDPPVASLYQTSVPAPAATAPVKVDSGTVVPWQTGVGAAVRVGVAGAVVTLTVMVAFGPSQLPVDCETW